MVRSERVIFRSKMALQHVADTLRSDKTDDSNTENRSKTTNYGISNRKSCL